MSNAATSRFAKSFSSNRCAISIPSFDRFIEPLLRLLAAHADGISAPKAQAALADQLGVTAEERREFLPSGIYPVYKSRIGWAHDRLKREGLSSSVERGFWQLTEKGRRYAPAWRTYNRVFGGICLI